MAVNTKNNRSTQDVDCFAGVQLKKRRIELGMSQKELAELVGVTFQQVQKYEKGLNRIGVSRLYEFCKILQVKPSYFFQDFKYGADNHITTGKIAESSDKSIDDIALLVSKFKKITDEEKKQLILNLIDSLSKSK